jgi:Fe-S oxidoreductase
VDKKKLMATMNLGRHFFQHMLRRALTADDKDGVGLSQFLSHYREDNIFEIDAFERERYHAFARCIQCNICQPYCVMFRAIGEIDFPGPMAVAATCSRGLSELGTTAGVIYNCTQCRLCETTCPENAPIAELVGFMRKYIFKYERDLVPQPLKDFCGTVRRHGAIFDEDVPEVIHEKNSAEYVLFLGCQNRYRQKQRVEAAVSMLKRLSIDFTMIDEVCCGAPLKAAGCGTTADIARMNIERIREKKTAKVITMCPHCLVAFCEGREYSGKLEAIHIAELLPQFQPTTIAGDRVTYHDPCMLGRTYGVFDDPRRALKLAGAKIVEMDTYREMAYCCGNWGGLGQSSPGTAESIARRRLEDARDTGADVLLTECPWCLEIFASTTLPEGKPRVRSVVEYLQNPEA